MRSLLVVGAHPDDELLLAGGTMAKYASEGAKLTLVCGTRGERGGTADLTTIEELPRVREQELREAMAIVGVSDVRFLPYEDQKLSKAPLGDARRLLVEVIREVRPSVVITFDPSGANQHPDHIAISRFTSDAVTAAADARWHPESGAAHHVARLLWQPPVPIWELNDEAELAPLPGFDFVIDISAWAAKKEAALRAHRTQVPAFGRLFFDHQNSRRLFAEEAFRVAWGPRPASVPAGDIFA